MSLWLLALSVWHWGKGLAHVYLLFCGVVEVSRSAPLITDFLALLILAPFFTRDSIPPGSQFCLLSLIMQQKTPFTDFTTDVDVVYTLHISPLHFWPLAAPSPPLLFFALSSAALTNMRPVQCRQHQTWFHIVSTALDPVIFSDSTIGTKCAEKTKHFVSLARPKSFEKLVIWKVVWEICTLLLWLWLPITYLVNRFCHYFKFHSVITAILFPLLSTNCRSHIWFSELYFL